MKDRKHNKICSKFYICIAVDRSLVSYNVSRETLVNGYTSKHYPPTAAAYFTTNLYISNEKIWYATTFAGVREVLRDVLAVLCVENHTV